MPTKPTLKNLQLQIENLEHLIGSTNSLLKELQLQVNNLDDEFDLMIQAVYGDSASNHNS